MQRVTVTLEKELLDELDRHAAHRGYAGRSEAVRDLVRAALAQSHGDVSNTGDCVGTLVYTYPFHVRALANRLAEVYHDHHDLTRATLRVQLDHDTCLECIVLCGGKKQVSTLASQVTAERGVMHGNLTLIPVDVTVQRHAHGGKAHEHSHIRVRQAEPD